MNLIRLLRLLLFFLSALEIEVVSVYAGDDAAKNGGSTRDIEGKVVCGYQGWFRAPISNSNDNRGWRHYGGHGSFAPGNAAIDLWPDVSELSESSRIKTSFRFPDGSNAYVFSSNDNNVVSMHFRWMREYGIDGAMVQRFPVDTQDAKFRESMDDVLRYCDTSSSENDRGYALMYDLSGVNEQNIEIVMRDWKHLIDSQVVNRLKSNYWHHKSKPLIALWGCGFNDRAPMLDAWRRLIEFLRDDPRYGGNAIMLGVPYHWLKLQGDSISDSALHELMASVDIISPWAVGRYGPNAHLVSNLEKQLQSDLDWCQSRQLTYMPVVFPGFSWHNLSKLRKVDAKFDQIPRQSGQFLWEQALSAKRSGCNMLYIAMFDELDEATAIMKVEANPPTGDSHFLAEPDLPSDHYLWLTGQIGKMMRSELDATQSKPSR